MHHELGKPTWLWIGCGTALVLATLFALHQLWQDVSLLRDAQVAVARLEVQLQRMELLRIQSLVGRRHRQSTADYLPDGLEDANKEFSIRLDAVSQVVSQQDLAPLRRAVDQIVRGSGDSKHGGELFSEAVTALNDARQSLEAEAEFRANVARFGTGIAITLLFAMLARLVVLIYVPERALAQEAEKQALERCEQRFQRLNEKSCDVVAILSCDGMIQYVGGGVETVLGRSPDDGLGRSIFSLLQSDEVALARQLIGSLATAPGAIRTEHFHYHHPCSGVRSLEVVVRNELQTEGIHGIVVNARDVTERVQAQERFRHEAFHDSLTGLPNRALFMERLQQAVNHARRDPAFKYAALFLDLVRFKLVNDSFGYSAGDDLLKAFAARLGLCVHGPTTLLDSGTAKQTITVCEHLLARIGGDEFCLLLESVREPSDAIRMGERILLRLRDSFFIGQADVFASTSIGVALGGPNYVSAEEVIRDADIAMYRAKAAGGARLKLYDEAMHQQALQQLKLETDLRRALERHEFEVAFQPIVLLYSGRVEGVEALIRWRHPQRGLVPPGEFISVAEATGLIVPLGRWMLYEACRQFHSLRHEPGAPTTLSVNFSTQEVSQPDLVAEVKHALQSSGLPGDCLHVEITESTMMSNVEQVSAMLLALKELGVRISVDDFGTGYSSLSYLRRLPIDALKIDRSFVLAMERDQESREIVHTILALARTLGLQTIAEGAETAEQVSQLKQMRCAYGQGYFFSKPVDIHTLRQRLQCWRLQCPVPSMEGGPNPAALEKLLKEDVDFAQGVENTNTQPVVEPLRRRAQRKTVPRKHIPALT